MYNLIKSVTNFFIVLLFISCAPQKTDKKNIIIILADDLGYSDLGYFGSEISTPNIDDLAEKGVVFTNFYSAPSCAPSRAMLLSGNDNHMAGIGIQAFSSENYGYEGSLSHRVKIIPEVLKENGYNTFLSGKWHIGGDPFERGFDKTFSLLPGAFTHYDNNKPIRGYPDTAFSQNGKKVLWEEGKYSTDVYTDKLIEFIDSSDDKPFFGYLSYTAPHWPLQVDKIFSDRYVGVYDGGYEIIKERRLNGMIKKGVLQEGSNYRSKSLSSSWNYLSSSQKAIESRKMEIYAGMISNLDFNVGRLISFLESKEILENTVIVFMSDNGAAAEDFYFNKTYGGYIKEKFTYDYDEMGSPKSFISIGKNWAEVITNPFKLYKGFTTSGGMRSPIIFYGIDNIESDIYVVFTSVLDVAPTLYSLTESDSEISVTGESIIPFLKKNQSYTHDENYVFAFEHSGSSILIKDKWKIVNNSFPFNKDNFELYQLSDISEVNNLKNEQNEVYNSLINDWESFVLENRIILPTPYRDDLN